MPSVKIVCAAVVAILSLAPGAASAAPCGRPDLIETFPKDGASDVPTNAQLTARYASSAEYVQEEVTFEHVGVGPEMATTRFDSNEGLLTLLPASPLVANESYHIEWPALRGISTAVLGKGATVTFAVGASPDKAAPSFAGVKSVDWDVERSNDDCTGGAEDRFLFDIGLSPASDDAKNDLLTLVGVSNRGALRLRGIARAGAHPAVSRIRIESSSSASPSSLPKATFASPPWFETRWDRSRAAPSTRCARRR